MKFLIFIGMTLGSCAGGYLPLLWDGGIFSFSSILLGTIGALIGIGVGFKVASYLGLQ